MLILASQSPRRKQLLEMAEVDFEVAVIPTDETYPADLPIDQIPIYIAEQKALAVKQTYPGRKILAADTIVVLDQEIIGKPSSREDAIRILSKLSGKEHQVITGVVIIDQERTERFSDTTRVAFHSIGLHQIEHYVDKYQPYDKAGAYAIQEWIGAIGIQSIHGCFYNVMGLPVSLVLQRL